MRTRSSRKRTSRGGRAVLLGVLLGLLAGKARGDARPPYVGAGACAASNCHGSVVPRGDSKLSIQNEYITWYKQDRHAKAYAVLLDERSFDIARRLGMVSGGDPATWLVRASHPERCLACHTLDVPAAERGPQFDVRDGVSCEACHGPAGGWIDRHAEAGWTPERSIALGMVDTRDPARAADICLACHLGSAGKRVDHDLIAAGHPALVFELDTFAANLPAHWKEHEANAGWFRAGPWVAGQAVTLRAAARNLTRQVRATGWPDFAAYDCYSCHHDLRPESRWRQDRSGGVPGRPPWEESRYAVLSDLVRGVAPDLAGPLDVAVRRLEQTAREGPGAPGLAAAAEAVATVADRFLARGTPLDAAGVDQTMRTIVGDGNRLAYAGFRTAQQVAWALDSLAVARRQLAGDGAAAARPVTAEGDPLRAAIGLLFDQLTNQVSYDPARFARDVRNITGQLP